MAGEIIRLGDRTSHDGTVIEGSQADICMGKPIAYLGHKVHCPKCKGDFPIVEGVMTTTFYGKGVAVAGMKTSCGAVLIASQFTDIVENAGGGGAAAAQSGAAAPQRQASNGHAAAAASAAAGAALSAAPDDAADELPHDEQFLLKDEDDVILAHMPYTVTLPSGERVHGVTDGEGRTLRYATAGAQDIEIYLGHID